ncbi:hypothetical protein GQR60_10430 [Labilibaculum sp. A4]|uniref:hypothetical protein n=1 Tax=Labilibaculum euxinus TaxID=2686357 RepID=UPI000F61F158|nr:hypothetical protein [Labilibaculum euxinus]MDQ1772662.1 hypothetical protein [Labilibaculum euxinus]MWN76760.1 hypothetical protein [Labilibaculum euxinus]
MKSSNKPRVIQSYEKLSQEIQEQIKLYYPEGYMDNLIEFRNHKNELVSALPFETEDKIYMVRMSVRKAQELIEDDDDFDDDGNLLDSKKESYEDKYSDSDSDFLMSDDDEDVDNIADDDDDMDDE